MYIASVLSGSQEKTCTKFVTAWYNNIAGFLSGRQDSTHPVTNDRKPATAPPFTIGSLRRAVPQHCFDRSLLKSGAYLLADLAVVAILLLGSRYIDLQNFWLGLLLWPVYWFCQVRPRLRNQQSMSPLRPASVLFCCLSSECSRWFCLKAIFVCHPGRRWHWPMGDRPRVWSPVVQQVASCQ